MISRSASFFTQPLTYHQIPRAILGEAPLWDQSSQTLYWVDCDQKILYRLDGQGRIDQFDLPHHPGSYAVRSAGGLIMAYRNQLALLDLDAGETTPLPAGPVDFSVERFNDGACDRKGRFWVGTMDRRQQDPVGSLYRIDPDLSVNKIESAFVVSNGIAFSPDDTVLYQSDSRASVIYAYDFDLEAGKVANRRIFVDFNGEPGRGDGCTVDDEGCLWVAQVGAGRLLRFDPDGSCVQTVGLPTARPTSVMFGGADLRMLYVTSMQFRLSPDELAQQPMAGCLIALTPGPRGVPEPQFAG